MFSRVAERHTSADWTDPDVVSKFPRLREATANEVILRAGEVMYVPEHWVHSIVNIGVSAQCNRCVVVIGDRWISTQTQAAKCSFFFLCVG